MKKAFTENNLPPTLNKKIIEAVRSSPREFELILKITALVARYLGVGKVNFLVGKNIPADNARSGHDRIIPIETVDNKAVSAWQVINCPGTLTGEQISELEVAGYILVLALENIIVKQQSIVDGLTKIYNRAYFDLRLKEEIEKSKRYGNPFSLLMVDIDHFKTFNDTYGHQVGDEVLRIVAGVLKQNTRASDIVFRYGGEEFAIFLQNVSEMQAMEVAERLRRHIDATVNAAERLRKLVKNNQLVKDDKVISISVSIGISAFSGARKDLTIGDIIKKADESLYRAKEMGRDRVEVIGRNETLKILIVDDETAYTDLLCDYFNTRGYKIMAANSGERALEILAKESFDVMLLDLRMPGITGLDVLHRVPDITKKMRVLVLTVITDEEIKKIVNEYGACEFLQKPVSIEYLNEHLMARILEMRA